MSQEDGVTSAEQVIELPIGLIVRGFFQPREHFESLAMETTKRSIQEKGQKYPIVVRPIKSGNPLFDPNWDEIHYELADGERRYRCCQELGYTHVKAIIRDLKDEEMLDYTLTTNDSLPLNPIERATVFSRLVNEFNRSQAEVANSFNLRQQQVSEYIRLLELPKEIQDLTARAVISVRHARELLKLQDKGDMEAMAREIAEKSVSTRDLAKKIKDMKLKYLPGVEKYEENDLFLDNLSENTQNNADDVKELVAAMDLLGSAEDEVDDNSILLKINRSFIPKNSYEKFRFWLKYTLRTNKKPEIWLKDVELSLFLGILAVLMAIFLPTWAVTGLLGLCITVLLSIFIIF